MKAQHHSPMTPLRAIAGGLVPTVILNEMLKINSQAGKSDWIYLPAHEWEQRTGVSKLEFEAAIKRLVIRGIVEELTSGKPVTRKFRINSERLQAALSGVA